MPLAIVERVAAAAAVEHPHRHQLRPVGEPGEADRRCRSSRRSCRRRGCRGRFRRAARGRGRRSRSRARTGRRPKSGLRRKRGPVGAVGDAGVEDRDDDAGGARAGRLRSGCARRRRRRSRRARSAAPPSRPLRGRGSSTACRPSRRAAAEASAAASERPGVVGVEGRRVASPRRWRCSSARRRRRAGCCAGPRRLRARPTPGAGARAPGPRRSPSNLTSSCRGAKLARRRDARRRSGAARRRAARAAIASAAGGCAEVVSSFRQVAAATPASGRLPSKHRVAAEVVGGHTPASWMPAIAFA